MPARTQHPAGESTAARPARLWRPGPRLIRPAVAAFSLLVLTSAALYSGGHNLDPQAALFHPVHNFLCDLFMPLNSYNGRPNTASAALGITAGLILVTCGLLPAWVSVAPRLYPGIPATRMITVAGMIALGAVVLVPLEKFLKLPTPHYVLLLCAAVPAWLATSGVALCSLPHPGVRHAARVLGLTVLLSVPGIFACYLPYAFAGDLTPPAIALGQKLVVLSVLAWLWTLAGSPALRD